MKSFTLRPFQEGVREQLKATNEILRTIEELNSLADSLEDGPIKANVLLAIRNLANVSDDLIDNAGQTQRYIRDTAA